VGRVRVGFVIDGIVRYCHYFNHANDDTFDSVYMSTPNLPLRYDVQSDGTNAAQVDHICSTVMSEGGVEETGILRSVDTGSTHIDASTENTTYAVLGIRLKSTYKDVTLIPQAISMMAETSTAFRWSLQLNPTVDDTFTYNAVSNSAVELAVGVTANDVTAEGLVVASGYVSDADKAGSAVESELKTSLRMGSLIDGTRDELVLCVTPLSADADIQASLIFREML